MSEIRFVPPAAMQAPPTAAERHDGSWAPTDETTWRRWVAFGGVMMVTLGAFQAVMGLTALLDQEYFLAARDDLPAGDYTSWGWTHLVVGVLAVTTGVALLARRYWARFPGLVLAGLSGLTNLGFLPAYPAWCATVIALDMVVVYALAVHFISPE